ncbi:hypothetical protein TOPH_03550 [Tolypocladium ophioglossoides CBS 100239]|uniref:Uncharacterized protein n=1 Tax=Tolypocladium ophioglossoides (strain CBS 100239) TaxID=1163406 RepID=A0A0L0NCY4_TOLOC|nr:hypothetical protein TOPH_03550 [Tolypocladium ophioglossoides CBS 100239]
MQDTIQPDSATLKQFYERGYRQWHEVYSLGLASPLDVTALDIQHAFPQHPYLVPELQLDTQSPGVIYATGTSTWQTSTGGCPLPSFEKRYALPVTARCPINISLRPNYPIANLDSFGQSGHIAILTLAWAYVLSQRWTEIIPGAAPIEYTTSLAAQPDSSDGFEETNDTAIELGVVTDEAARWWVAVLAPGEGWLALTLHRGTYLRSPWSVSLQPSEELTLSFRTTPFRSGHQTPPSFSTAAGYIADYASYHGAEDQSCAAFAAALLLPTRRYVSDKLCWPCPSRHNERPEPPARQCWPPWGEDRRQLDRLLTMSCNTIGMLSLVSSSFVDPDIPCNVGGAWMQGAFAIIDELSAQAPLVLAIAYIIDLHSAAWTESFVSFVQRAVADYPPHVETIQRADEARLMFLSQADHHSEPPLVLFPPFGAIAVKDCILEVQLHSSCGGRHGLVYAGWAWDCQGNVKVGQDPHSSPSEVKHANRQPVADIAIRYDKLDRNRDCSEALTRNMFKWLRDADGYPVAERGIRDWIDDDWSSGEESVAPEGDGKSTTGSSRRSVDIPRSNDAIVWPIEPRAVVTERRCRDWAMPSPMCGGAVAPEIGPSLGHEDHVTITLYLVSASSEYQTGAANSSTPSNMDEHEAAKLLRLLEEAKSQLNQEQRRREEADQRLQEEQQRREEEQRRREEEQQRREEERKRREEADRQRDEANRQREAAEALAGSALPQTVPDYLEAARPHHIRRCGDRRSRLEVAIGATPAATTFVV